MYSATLHKKDLAWNLIFTTSVTQGYKIARAYATFMNHLRNSTSTPENCLLCLMYLIFCKSVFIIVNVRKVVHANHA